MLSCEEVADEDDLGILADSSTSKEPASRRPRNAETVESSELSYSSLLRTGLSWTAEYDSLLSSSVSNSGGEKSQVPSVCFHWGRRAIYPVGTL